MAKRIAVKYVGSKHSRHSSMRFVPEGTEFKGVISPHFKGTVQGVLIRGSNLTKACNKQHKFKAKEYLFLLDSSSEHNSMEVVTTKELS